MALHDEEGKRKLFISLSKYPLSFENEFNECPQMKIAVVAFNSGEKRHKKSLLYA